MEQMLFIYNPTAGQGKVHKNLAEILDAFVAQGYLPTVYPTQGPGDATRLARDIGQNYPRIVCCGGDGTLHEVITALAEMERPPVLGYIPAGSTNDVSRNLALPKDMAEAAKVAVGPENIRYDIGRFNEKPFVYVAAFGLFTDVSYATSQKFKNIFGHLAYILKGVGSLTSIKSWEVKVECDEGVVEGDFILGMVSNTRSVGGFQSLPVTDVELDDGKFELILVRRPHNPAQLQAILHSVITQNPKEDGPVIALRASRVKFTSDSDLEWTLDGEYGGACNQVEIRNICQALKLCCPREEQGPEQDET